MNPPVPSSANEIGSAFAHCGQIFTFHHMILSLWSRFDVYSCLTNDPTSVCLMPFSDAEIGLGSASRTIRTGGAIHGGESPVQ
jgi:hypothetical protein